MHLQLKKCCSQVIHEKRKRILPSGEIIGEICRAGPSLRDEVIESSPGA